MKDKKQKNKAYVEEDVESLVSFCEEMAFDRKKYKKIANKGGKGKKKKKWYSHFTFALDHLGN